MQTCNTLKEVLLFIITAECTDIYFMQAAWPVNSRADITYIMLVWDTAVYPIGLENVLSILISIYLETDMNEAKHHC